MHVSGGDPLEYLTQNLYNSFWEEQYQTRTVKTQLGQRSLLRSVLPSAVHRIDTSAKKGPDVNLSVVYVGVQ